MQLMNPLMPAVKASMVKTLRDALQIVEAIPERRDCAACDFWHGGQCQRWNAVPPAEVQAAGCEAFVSTVPF